MTDEQARKVDLIATRVMGWERFGSHWGRREGMNTIRDHIAYADWNPFLHDADAMQVLRRMAELGYTVDLQTTTRLSICEVYSFAGIGGDLLRTKGTDPRTAIAEAAYRLGEGL